jgi:hypothetical protein
MGYAHSHASLHPHFASPGLCFAKPLYGLAKRRIPGTLCAIGFELVEEYKKMLNKDIDRENKLI